MTGADHRALFASFVVRAPSPKAKAYPVLFIARHRLFLSIRPVARPRNSTPMAASVGSNLRPSADWYRMQAITFAFSENITLTVPERTKVQGSLADNLVCNWIKFPMHCVGGSMGRWDPSKLLLPAVCCEYKNPPHR